MCLCACVGFFHTHVVVPLGCDGLCVVVCVCHCASMLGCVCVLMRALYTKVFVCVACDLLRDDVCVIVCVL